MLRVVIARLGSVDSQGGPSFGPVPGRSHHPGAQLDGGPSGLRNDPGKANTLPGS